MELQSLELWEEHLFHPFHHHLAGHPWLQGAFEGRGLEGRVLEAFPGCSIEQLFAAWATQGPSSPQAKQNLDLAN